MARKGLKGAKGLKDFKLLLPTSHIHNNTRRQSRKKQYGSEHIHNRFVNRERREIRDQKMYIGIAFRGITQRLPNIPVPVGEETIPEPIENTQNEPGKSCKQQSDQI